ncbi:hypothetical protein Syun_006724 [Stephania yunnanensis]|uniref:Uncharacterized protein n=1 Tax=Stephania yunnanensis TaxID=152371 RepID=A0AAP0KYK8_9MAGN
MEVEEEQRSNSEVFQEEVQDTASVSVSDKMDALQLMRNDMIPTEVDVSTSRRDDVSSVGIIIDSESDEDVEVMDYSNDENEFVSTNDDRGNVVPSQIASATNSHVFDQISSQVVTDPTATLSNTGGQFKKGRGKAKNVALDQYLAKNNGIKPKVNIPDGKLKPVGAWAAEFTTGLGIICRTYAPIRVAQWKKMEQKDKEQIYNLIRDKFEIDLNFSRILFAVNKMLSRRFKGYKHELHKYYQTFNSYDGACEKPFNDVSAEDWELCCQEFASTKFKEEMIEIQSQPSLLTEDEIYKEVMDKKSDYARGSGYDESEEVEMKENEVEELTEILECLLVSTQAILQTFHEVILSMYCEPITRPLTRRSVTRNGSEYIETILNEDA